MEIMKRMQSASLKKSFFYAMICTVALIILLSVLTIWGCFALQKWILPDSDEVYLSIKTIYDDGTEEVFWQRMEFGSEDALGKLTADGDAQEMPEQKGITRYSIERVENGFQTLSPKRKAAYSFLSAAMVALPAVYSIAGVLLCAAWFYRKKLDGPIRILSAATENIANENLDFTVRYDSADEMGKLCDSFEKMRETLCENNRSLWAMLEERRMLQASVAHDLRNPISIIEGYAEYLQENIPEGRLSEEKLLHTVSNLSTAAKRLERYTDSIRDIHHLEDMEVRRIPCKLPALLEEMADDFIMMARQEGIRAEIAISVPDCKGMVDRQILYRVLENLLTNALRFAKHTVQISFSVEDTILTAVIQDDGAGFPKKILESKGQYLFSTDASGGHIGMGLVISRILCKKHGGELVLSDAPEGGAKAEVRVSVA
ncbi:HAMP domain-containing sensor histidine kinase [Candidatus Soleaferrea massiliensis]|uniref:HAMP domain-containing sensor histidine kinase n=1 Tax=Candidatus Soleaferrea massiliensis TaxID=1470354 RepID=UPI000590C155|nr:HAMP domain-containing sensor histidine kinase [Candidatus Soleaferrea massiliensis]